MGIVMSGSDGDLLRARTGAKLTEIAVILGHYPWAKSGNPESRQFADPTEQNGGSKQPKSSKKQPGPNLKTQCCVRVPYFGNSHRCRGVANRDGKSSPAKSEKSFRPDAV
jgi:hypothetical protein